MLGIFSICNQLKYAQHFVKSMKYNINNQYVGQQQTNSAAGS